MATETYIRDKANVSVSVILDRKGNHVATVRWLFPRDGAGTVRCEVQTPGQGITYRGRAGGYGYDKRTATLAGAVIAGIRIADHCGQGEESHEKAKTRLMARYIRARYIRACAQGMTADEVRAFETKARAMGAHFENWCRAPGCPVEPDGQGGTRPGYRYTSLHTMSGLDRLSALGFRVIDAV